MPGSRELNGGQTFRKLIDSLGVDLLSQGDPQRTMVRLVQLAAEYARADRCTLTSLDQHVIRVEASYESDASPPSFVGKEYSLDYLREQPLIAEAVASGSIVTGRNFTEDGRVDPSLAESLASVRRVAIVPLPIGESIGAVLVLSRTSERDFIKSELEPLQQIGVLAVVALRNARLINEIRRAQVRGLETLTLISQHVASSDEREAFFGKMSETVAHLVNASRAAFFRIVGDELVAQPQGHGFTEEELGAMHAHVPTADSRTPLARLLYAGEAVRHVAGEYGDDEVQAHIVGTTGARDVLIVPWRTAQAPIGMLLACDSVNGFTEQDEWITRLAARASALVWQGYSADHRAAQLQSEERERLSLHASRMAELERQKSEFLQLASHELRTPITLIVGYLSMLEEGVLGEIPDAVKQVLPLMSSRMSQMNQIVDRMLTASRMLDTSTAIEVQPVLVDQVVHDVRESLELIRAKHQTVRIDGMEGVRAQADPEQLETILRNLLSNAIKYSPDGGDIIVSIDADPEWVTIAVKDRGLGIDEADIPKLFQPFRRLDKAQSAGIEGTGLGLYLSRQLAVAQGGDIEVESQPNEGSTFRLRLPRASD